ncbi:hypothetical protein LZ30DRAFT_154490 [Colletotrichum cereale]|nr:hypothetical protein LZ30DRAFT_154490 [Colletotrichum cereale]
MSEDILDWDSLARTIGWSNTDDPVSPTLRSRPDEPAACHIPLGNRSPSHVEQSKMKYQKEPANNLLYARHHHYDNLPCKMRRRGKARRSKTVRPRPHLGPKRSPTHRKRLSNPVFQPDGHHRRRPEARRPQASRGWRGELRPKDVGRVVT